MQTDKKGTRKRKVKTLEEQIWARMTPLERAIVGRGGEWILKNGRHWDEGLSSYVLRCEHCKHYFLSQRSHTKTCSAKCKKARQRANAAVNFQASTQTRF